MWLSKTSLLVGHRHLGTILVESPSRSDASFNVLRHFVLTCDLSRPTRWRKNHGRELHHEDILAQLDLQDIASILWSSQALVVTSFTTLREGDARVATCEYSKEHDAFPRNRDGVSIQLMCGPSRAVFTRAKDIVYLP